MTGIVWCYFYSLLFEQVININAFYVLQCLKMYVMLILFSVLSFSTLIIFHSWRHLLSLLKLFEIFIQMATLSKAHRPLIIGMRLVVGLFEFYEQIFGDSMSRVVTGDILSVYSQELIHWLKEPLGMLQWGNVHFCRRKKMTLHPRGPNQPKRRHLPMSKWVTPCSKKRDQLRPSLCSSEVCG